MRTRGHTASRIARPASAHLIAAIFYAFFCLSVIGQIRAVHANGWEHLAIPRATLLAALESGDPHFMEHAAISIGVRGEARDVEPLLGALESADEAHHLRSEIYRALGQIGDVGGVPALLRAMRTEARDELRATAAIALGAIGSPEALPALLAALETEKRIVRLRVIDALGAFAQMESISALAALSEQDPDEAIRLQALHALGATGSSHAAAPLIIALDEAEDRRTRAVIIDALANIANPVAAAPLADLLQEIDDPILEVKLATALGAIGGEGQLPTLAQLLWSDSRTVQTVAVRMLTEARSPGTASDLSKLYGPLAESRPQQLASAMPADAASYLADLDLMKLTVRALLETDPEIGLEAFLDAAQPRRFERTSTTGLKLAHKAYELRRLAIYSLGYTESAAATTTLLPLAKDEADPRLRSVAVRSLGVLGNPKSYAIALNALSDSDPEVRWTAAIVLGRLGQMEAVPALINLVGDQHQHVRLQSAVSLGLLGDERAIQSLEKLSTADDSETVRESARQALILIASGGIH